MTAKQKRGNPMVSVVSYAWYAMVCAENYVVFVHRDGRVWKYTYEELGCA